MMTPLLFGYGHTINNRIAGNHKTNVIKKKVSAGDRGVRGQGLEMSEDQIGFY